MGLLDRLASIFIDVFGITQPTDKTRRRASWFIATLLVFTVALVVAVGILLHRLMHA
jgi:hypothetical protein